MMQPPPIKVQPKRERAVIDDVMRYKNIYYRVRKITNKDVILRPMTNEQAKKLLDQKGHKT